MILQDTDRQIVTEGEGERERGNIFGNAKSVAQCKQ